MAKLHIDSISKSFPKDSGEVEQVLENVSFVADSGSFTSLLGPSGCGKTTLLNIISGLLKPDGGVIKKDEKPLREDERSMSYVFQEPRLLDWATAGENIKYVLEGHNIPEKEHAKLIEKYLRKVDLEGEADSYPRSLSGGMQQRVGIARALAVESDVVLMDEPFSSLDEITARNLRNDLLKIWDETNQTIIFVTHNIRESIYLSDNVLVMAPKKGIIHKEQIDLGRPRDMEDTQLLQLESRLMKIMNTNSSN